MVLGPIGRKLFPLLQDHSADSPAMAAARKESLQHVHGEVLEIGFGCGHSLAYYPGTIRSLTAVDKSGEMLKRASRRITGADINVTVYFADAAHMPFADQSYDCVVSHMTLCSLADIEGALLEVRRVLKLGGTFTFLEHGLSPESSIRKWQNRWNPIQKFISDGCHCNRRIDDLITAAGMQIETLKTYHMGDAPRVLDYMYQGTAIKGADTMEHHTQTAERKEK